MFRLFAIKERLVWSLAGSTWMRWIVAWQLSRRPDFGCAPVVDVGTLAFTNTYSGGLGDLERFSGFSGVVLVVSLLDFCSCGRSTSFHATSEVGMQSASVQRTSVYLVGCCAFRLTFQTSTPDASGLSTGVVSIRALDLWVSAGASHVG